MGRVKSGGTEGGPGSLCLFSQGGVAATDPSRGLREAEDEGAIILLAFRRSLAEKNRFRT